MDIKELIAREEVGTSNLDRHFQCYFHNKMMVLLMMIEHPFLYTDVCVAEREKISLDDLCRHFLPFGVHTKYHHAFKWLRLFLDRFPNVSSRRTEKALEMVRLVYEGFGFKSDLLAQAHCAA